MIGTDSKQDLSQNEATTHREFIPPTFDLQIIPCNCQPICHCGDCGGLIQPFTSNEKLEKAGAVQIEAEAEEMEEFLNLIGETGILKEPEEIENIEKTTTDNEEENQVEEKPHLEENTDLKKEQEEMEEFLQLMGETGMIEIAEEKEKEAEDNKCEMKEEPQALILGVCHCTGKCRTTCPGYDPKKNDSYDNKKDEEVKKLPSNNLEPSVVTSSSCGCPEPCLCSQETISTPVSVMIDECFCESPCRCEICPGPKVSPHKEIQEVSPPEEIQEVSPPEEIQEVSPPEEIQEVSPPEKIQEVSLVETPNKLTEDCTCTSSCLCENCTAFKEKTTTSVPSKITDCTCRETCTCKYCSKALQIQVPNEVVKKISICQCEIACLCAECPKEKNTVQKLEESSHFDAELKKEYVCKCESCACVKCPGLNQIDESKKEQDEIKTSIKSSQNESEITCDCSGPCLPECIRNKNKPKSEDEICDCSEPCLPECIRNKNKKSQSEEETQQITQQTLIEKICDCTEPCSPECSGRKITQPTNIFDLIKSTIPCDCVECKCQDCEKSPTNREKVAIEQPDILEKIKPTAPCSCPKPCQCKSCPGMQNADIITVKVATDVDFCNCVEQLQDGLDESKLAEKKNSCHCTDSCIVGCPGYNKNKETEVLCKCEEPCRCSECSGKKNTRECDCDDSCKCDVHLCNNKQEEKPLINDNSCKCEACQCISCPFIKVATAPKLVPEKHDLLKRTSSGCSCAPTCVCENCYFFNKEMDACICKPECVCESCELNKNNAENLCKADSICKCSIHVELCNCSVTSEIETSRAVQPPTPIAKTDNKCTCFPSCQCEECPILNEGLDKGKCGCTKPCPCDNCLGLTNRNKVVDPDFNRDCCCSIPCNCEKCPTNNFQNIMDVFTSVSITCLCESSCTCFYCGGRPKSQNLNKIESIACVCITKCTCTGCEKNVQ